MNKSFIIALLKVCTPPKKKKKKKEERVKSENSETIPSKGHPRARTLAEFKETFPDNFYAEKRRNPLVQIHAPGSKHRYPCTQSAGGVPK